MKKAIITGATGLIGLSVARHLSSKGIEVLCLGRKVFSQQEASRHFGMTSTYIQLRMEDIRSLENFLNELNWSPGNECVFFNFAWSGITRLTDGDFEIQLNNSIHSAQAVRVAKKIGCIKFVNLGTIEETFLEHYLTVKEPESRVFSQTDYALAKMASRDMCKIIAYIEKIDYIHTRLSAPINLDLKRDSYITNTLRLIANREPFVQPKNKQLFDLITTNDVAFAFELIGHLGKNKSNYFIGTGKPATLSNYFDYFAQQVKGLKPDNIQFQNNVQLGFFSTESIKFDTGFVANTHFEQFFDLINL
jgi:nucleoside-diphosphate-sugar epimerase